MGLCCCISHDGRLSCGQPALADQRQDIVLVHPQRRGRLQHLHEAATTVKQQKGRAQPLAQIGMALLEGQLALGCFD
ncbi:hypothetical protein D3C77_778810 [compost metagenome]